MDFELSELLKLLSIIRLATYRSRNVFTDSADEAVFSCWGRIAQVGAENSRNIPEFSRMGSGEDRGSSVKRPDLDCEEGWPRTARSHGARHLRIALVAARLRKQCRSVRTGGAPQRIPIHRQRHGEALQISSSGCAPSQYLSLLEILRISATTVIMMWCY